MTGVRGSVAALLCAALLAAGCVPAMPPMGQLSGDAPGLAHEAFQARDGARLPLRCWQPQAPFGPRAVVVALHGFNDYSNAFDAPGRFLAGKGIAVYAYDQRGFGRSPQPGLWAGTGPMVGDLLDVAAEVRRRHPGVPVYLLGESMGGAVAMVAAAGGRLAAYDGMILVAPAVWGRAVMPLPYRTVLFLAAHSVPWLTLTGRGLGKVASDNIPMLRALGRDPLVIKETRVDAIYGLVDLMDAALASSGNLADLPTLMLYGDRDEIIPPGAIGAAISALPRAGKARPRLAFYGEGYHMLLRDLGAATVLEDVAAWIADPDAPLPSGADRRPPPSGKARERDPAVITDGAPSRAQS